MLKVGEVMVKGVWEGGATRLNPQFSGLLFVCVRLVVRFGPSQRAEIRFRREEKPAGEEAAEEPSFLASNRWKEEEEEERGYDV